MSDALARTTLLAVLHVTNGDSAVMGLRAAGAAGDVVAWRDVLHEGPVPADLGEAELRAVRARFLAAQGWAAEQEARADMEARDARLARAVADGEELVLWFETDLYDMLQLAQILDRLVPGTATLIITGEERFAGVGELDPAELRELLDGGDAGGLGRRLPVDAALAEAGRAVWTAVRQPEPGALAAVTDTAALPALGDAVRRHQQQYPWRGSNLNRTERALLEAVQAGARTRMHAFVAQQRGEERPFMGDSTAFAYLGALAGGPDALLQDNGSLRLTARGEAVLAGGRAWAGRPERWLGGVHLPAGTPPWSWDPVAGEIV